MLFDLGFMHGWDYAEAREAACKAEANRQQREYERNKYKMTREEAFALAKNIGNTKPWYEDTVTLLEALGLLKFDEPKEDEILVGDNTGTNVRVRRSMFEAAMRNAGYVVILA